MATDAFTLLILPACLAVVGGLALGIAATGLLKGVAAVVPVGWGVASDRAEDDRDGDRPTQTWLDFDDRA